jgi:hypothetical protein
MRLVEYLIHLLEAHAQTLQRLAALLGESTLVEILESTGEEMEQNTAVGGASEAAAIARWFEDALPSGYSPYIEIEGAVREFNLPAMLEFHLWAYPHYRSFVEGPLDLNSRIQGPGGDAGLALVDEAVAQAQAWVRALHLPPALGLQAERAAHMPWLRFRTNVLKRIGKRPIGPVY